jgi:CRP-like cAMP-binding protein
MSPSGITESPIRSRLLRGLEPRSLEAIRSGATPVTRRRGETLFRQGAAAQRVYIVEQGQVKLTQLTRDGQLVFLRLAVAGDAIAGVAALGERTYPVSAEAVGDCRCLSWSGRTMDRLFRAHPQLAINFIEFLAERLHEMQSRYEELATEQVEQRLARMLLRLVSRAGRRVEEGVLIDVRLTRQDLAEMTGTTLFTVSRVLGRWQKQGMIKAQRQRIIVRHPHGLVSIGEGLDSRSIPADGT